MNLQNGYDVPIMAVLCDGKRFYFFRFLNPRKANTSVQVSLSKFADGHRGISIDDTELTPGTDPRTFYRQIRKICENLYYVFLSGYQSGLEAYWDRSVARGKAKGKARDSTPGWYNAKVQAGKASSDIVQSCRHIGKTEIR